jgi:hypothetical protein
MPRLKIKRPNAKKPSPSKRSLFIKIFLLLILIPVIATAIFLIRYYYIFDGTIQMKLGRRNQLAEIKIFAAPTVLYPGKRIGCSELVSKIRRLGYEENSTGASYYQVGKADTVLIHNEGSIPSDANRTAEIKCAGNTVRSIKDPATQCSPRKTDGFLATEESIPFASFRL